MMPSASCDASPATRSSVCAAIASSFSTMVNWAVWAMNCELSTGSIGFWYLSWATSSLRNASFPSVVWASICVVAPSVGPAVGGGVVSSAIRAALRVTASMVTGVPFVPLEEQVEPAGDGRMDGANRGVALPVSGGPGAMRAADGSGRAALAGPAPAAGPDADATSGEAGVGEGRTQVGQGGRGGGAGGGGGGGAGPGGPGGGGGGAVRQPRNRPPGTVPAITAGQHRNRRPFLAPVGRGGNRDGRSRPGGDHRRGGIGVVE